MEFKLYNYFRSSSSYRVRIALEYKNLPYSYVPVHLLNNGGEQNSADYQVLNSKREVPTLVHNDNVIAQSVAIIEYLEEIKPEPALFPADPLLKAHVRQACEIINSGIQPLQNLSVLNKLTKDYGITDDQKKVWISDVVTPGLKAFEEFISNKSGEYCFGDTITAADLFLIPQIFSAVRFGVDIKQFKTLSKINDRCLDLKAFKLAHPDSQPDSPN